MSSNVDTTSPIRQWISLFGVDVSNYSLEAMVPGAHEPPKAAKERQTSIDML